MGAVTVRYTVKPERVAENAALVRAVYAELAELVPSGFRYATFLEPDGRTFRHVAIAEDDVEPLPGLESFRRFRSGLADRCVAQPEVSELETVGAYRFEPGPDTAGLS